VNYLTTHQLLFLHWRLIDETGGSHGLQDLALLESAVDRPRATAKGEDLYADLFSKAAALMQSLMLNRPFLEGNERTAIASAALFLLQNDRQLVASNRELEQFTPKIAPREIGMKEIAAWFRKNSKPLA